MAVAPHTSTRLVAIYVRVSTDEQAEHGYSLGDQQARGAAWIASQHTPTRPTVLMGAYADEGYSGATRYRPALRQMLDDAQAGRVTTIVFTQLDRLARRLKLLLELWDQLEEWGCTIIVLDESIDTSTPVGRLVRNVLGSIAEFERELIAGRMRHGRLAKARAGHLWKAQCPYGYRYLRKEEGVRAQGELLIDEEEASAVRLIFDLAAGGMAQHAIAAELGRRGVRPRRGGAAWKQGTISDLLRNRTYMGDAIYNQRVSIAPKRPTKDVEHRRREKSAHTYRPEEEWIHVPAPAIVEPAVWHVVAARRAGNIAASTRNAKRVYMLGHGLLRCGVCRPDPTDGQRLSMVGHMRRTWYRYECSDAWRTGRTSAEAASSGTGDATVCKHYVAGPLIEERVWAAVMEMVAAPALLAHDPADASEDAACAQARTTGHLADDGAGLRLAAVRRQHDLLVDNLGQATTPAQIAAMLAQIEALDQRRQDAERATAAEEARRQDAAAHRAAAAFARDVCRDIAQTAVDAPLIRRAALLRVLVDEIIVYADHADVRGALTRGAGHPLRVQLQREAANNSVARREVARLGGGTDGVLGEERAVRGDVGRQVAVLRRVDHVDAAGENGQRAPARVEGRAVGQAVDAARESAHDSHVVTHQVGHEPMRHLAAVRRHGARADDGHGPFVLRQQLAARVEDGRGVIDVGQPRGITLVGEGVRLHASALHAPPQRGDIDGTTRRDGRPRDFGLDARVDEFGG